MRSRRVCFGAVLFCRANCRVCLRAGCGGKRTAKTCDDFCSPHDRAKASQSMNICARRAETRTGSDVVRHPCAAAHSAGRSPCLCLLSGCLTKGPQRSQFRSAWSLFENCQLMGMRTLRKLRPMALTSLHIVIHTDSSMVLSSGMVTGAEYSCCEDILGPASGQRWVSRHWLSHKCLSLTDL